MNNYNFPMKLWEINLYKDDSTPIAFDKLWAYFALLKEDKKICFNAIG